MQEGERCKMHVDVGCYGARGIARDVERPKAAMSELLRHPNVLGIKAFLSPLPPNAGGGGMPGDNARSELLDVAKLCGTYNKPILVHSELMSTADLDESMRRCFPPDDGTMDDSHHAHAQSRPAEWKRAAVTSGRVEATECCVICT